MAYLIKKKESFVGLFIHCVVTITSRNWSPR